jgi:hypothetical protein
MKLDTDTIGLVVLIVAVPTMQGSAVLIAIVLISAKVN